MLAGCGSTVGQPLTPSGAKAKKHRAVVPKPIAATEAGLLPWSLSAPLSRAVALPGPAGTLYLVGGLTTGGLSATGVFTLATGTGTLAPAGSLAQAVHDAAGALVAGKITIFGGGNQSVVSAVQQEVPPAGTAPATTGTGAGSSAGSYSSVGHLPTPRADLAGVSIGSVTYLLGGYDGHTLSADVLMTTDGKTFRTAGQLAQPVRYPAVAALGGQIYLFGGTGASGVASTAVQVFDTATGKGRLIAHLRAPLTGASAGTLGGHIYLAGGDTGGVAKNTVWAFDTGHDRLLKAGELPVATAYASATVAGGKLWLIGGENSGGSPISSVEAVSAAPAFGTAGAVGAGSPYFGDTLLVADRGNNRLLALNTADQVTWEYPSAQHPAPASGFYFPDDAFFTHHGTAILTNQEEQDTLIEVGYPSGKVLWSYGHPNQPGSAPGYLHQPDDAYLLENGQVTVADALNCRILFIDQATGKPVKQIGTTGVCAHQPPAEVGYPNGDTPLANGDVLVSEIDGSWVTEYSKSGHLVWTVQLPIAYPSDPQQLGPDRYLIADYTAPGEVLQFNRAGQLLYTYDVTSGPGRLDHPSLAELLPSGMIMVNDDYNDRMVAIDPIDGALVWQYGVTGQPGTGPGLLNTPDGFDVLTPRGTTPTHPTTG